MVGSDSVEGRIGLGHAMSHLKCCRSYQRRVRNALNEGRTRAGAHSGILGGRAAFDVRAGRALLAGLSLYM